MTSDKINAECPVCEGTRSCDVLFKKKHDWSHEESGMYGTNTYYALQCRGCENIFFQSEEICSEDYDEEGVRPTVKRYPPIERVKRKNRFLDEFYLEFEHFERALFSEIYKAINGDMRILAAMGIRSLIDHIAARLTGSNENYSKNMNNLVDRGYASPKQKEILDAALELGHGAVHRGHIPTPHQIELALDIAENMIETFLVNKEKAETLSQNIPSRSSCNPQRS